MTTLTSRTQSITKDSMVVHFNLDLGQYQITVTNIFRLSLLLDWLLFEGHWNTVSNRDQPNKDVINMFGEFDFSSLCNIATMHNTLKTLLHLHFTFFLY